MHWANGYIAWRFEHGLGWVCGLINRVVILAGGGSPAFQWVWCAQCSVGATAKTCRAETWKGRMDGRHHPLAPHPSGGGGGGKGGCSRMAESSPPTLEFTTPLPSWPSSSLRLTSISCFNLPIHKVIKISDRLTETAHRNHKTPRNIRFPCHHTPDAAGRTPLHQTQCLQIPQRRRTTDHGCNPRRSRPHWCRGRTRDARRRRFCRRRHRSRWISRRNRNARCKGDTTRRARTAKSRQLRRQRRIGRCFWTEGVQDTVPAPSATTLHPSSSKERLTCR